MRSVAGAAASTGAPKLTRSAVAATSKLARPPGKKLALPTTEASTKVVGPKRNGGEEP